MTREAINLTMSEPLRRAQVRQRLDALVKLTGLAQAQLAGRALTIGLGHIERDLSQIFPGVAEPPSAAAQTHTPPRVDERSAEQPGAATQLAEAPHNAPPRMPVIETAPLSAAHRAVVPLPQEKPEPEPPRSAPQSLLDGQQAARALGYGTKAAFMQHIHRHPELKRCGRRTGRSMLWDLGKLRAEYERKGWAPK